MAEKYRKKPVVIEAKRFETNNDDGECLDELVKWITDCGGVASHNGTDLFISTLEGEMRGEVGDMIIKGVNGEFYPCKSDIFEKTYDEAFPCDEEVEPSIRLSFSEALRRLRRGNRIARSGWNGKGMFVVYQKGYPEGIEINENTQEALGLPSGTLCRFRPYLLMKTAQDDYVPWVASQSDILAEDWELV